MTTAVTAFESLSHATQAKLVCDYYRDMPNGCQWYCCGSHSQYHNDPIATICPFIHNAQPLDPLSVGCHHCDERCQLSLGNDQISDQHTLLQVFQHQMQTTRR